MAPDLGQGDGCSPATSWTRERGRDKESLQVCLLVRKVGLNPDRVSHAHLTGHSERQGNDAVQEPGPWKLLESRKRGTAPAPPGPSVWLGT